MFSLIAWQRYKVILNYATTWPKKYYKGGLFLQFRELMVYNCASNTVKLCPVVYVYRDDVLAFHFIILKHVGLSV